MTHPEPTAATNPETRVIVPTSTYQGQRSPSYEEADLIEEWCEERVDGGVELQEAATEAVKWLREDTDTGMARQEMLEDPQNRSTVRKQMRSALRSLR
ncbi:MAG: hypothetical protein ABWY29_06660 [Blastococcus sp.]